MEGLAGATLRVKLRHFEPWTEARRAIAAKYNDVLPASELIRTPDMPRARRP
jgi:dTDP-4-amino-4,6-dideoxygalactose transaminase